MKATRVFHWALSGVLGFALAAAGIAAAAPPSGNQEVKIEASKVVTIEHGHAQTGIQNETVQLSHTINFADLDLGSAAGASELKSRITNTATQICKQLGTLYPAGSPGVDTADRDACVKGAVDAAMGQARLAIASAQKAKHS